MSSSTRPARSPGACRSWSMPMASLPDAWRSPPPWRRARVIPIRRPSPPQGRRRQCRPVALADLGEHPGAGLEARIGDKVYRLGRADWALPAATAHGGPGVVLSEDGRLLCRLRLRGRAAGRRARGRRRAEGEGHARRDPVRRSSTSRCVGSPRRSTCRVVAGVSPAAKVDRIAALADGRAQGPDGGRRPQRRAGAGRRPCLHGAGIGGRHRAQRRRHRLPARRPPRRCRRPSTSPARRGTWSGRTCCSPSPTTRSPCRLPSSAR